MLYIWSAYLFPFSASSLSFFLLEESKENASVHLKNVNVFRTPWSVTKRAWLSGSEVTLWNFHLQRVAGWVCAQALLLRAAPHSEWETRMALPWHSTFGVLSLPQSSLPALWKQNLTKPSVTVFLKSLVHADLGVAWLIRISPPQHYWCFRLVGSLL